MSQHQSTIYITLGYAEAVIAQLKESAEIVTFNLIEKSVPFEQTHWLYTQIDDVEVAVINGRVYHIGGIDLGSVDDLKQQGLEPLKKKQ